MTREPEFGEMSESRDLQLLGQRQEQDQARVARLRARPVFTRAQGVRCLLRHVVMP